jgi:hypothetical protein
LAVFITLLVLTSCGTRVQRLTPRLRLGLCRHPWRRSSSAPALGRAADGDDLSACKDGACEVRIEGPTSIPVDPRYAVENLRVTTITDTKITITITAAPGRAQFDRNAVRPVLPAGKVEESCS